MTGRFWEPAGLPCDCDELLKDWVSKEVVSAFDEFMDEVDVWISPSDEALKIEVLSFMKPDGGVWHKEFDLVELVMTWADRYEGCAEERARQLDDLAAKFRAKEGLRAINTD